MRSLEWEMPCTNRKGRAVLNIAARLGLQVANLGFVFTYRRPGCGNSIVDVTFVSERVAGLIRSWRVSEELTGSDHQYILFELTNPEEARPARSAGWSVKRLDRNRLEETLQEAAVSRPLLAGIISILVDQRYREITPGMHKGWAAARNRPDAARKNTVFEVKRNSFARPSNGVRLDAGWSIVAKWVWTTEDRVTS